MIFPGAATPAQRFENEAIASTEEKEDKRCEQNG
jgi:hypothetical protein